MSVVGKALWYIENHFLSGDLTLEHVADHCGVSRWHLARLFPLATGRSVGAYIRGRRLTEAARALAAGAPDILSLALDHGYGSHEAFTRAFRAQFGLTPEEVRGRRTLPPNLMEPIRMDSIARTHLPPPRIREAKPLLLAGYSEEHSMSDVQAVPAQWQRVAPFLDDVPNGIGGPTSYGVVSSTFSERDRFQYLVAVEVSRIDELPPELTALRLPAQRYACFAHEGHLAGIRNTIHAVFADWLPTSGEEAASLPDFIEYYGPAFDPEKGEGDVEIWLPLKG